MKILVVSGFLGAGKTTFIKELIRQTGIFPAILENEYGENNLDSAELSKSGDMKILEFMEGCVCCTKKDSFVNSILAISAGLDPEYLVVEPTGVGKLGNILSNICQISYERIQLLRPVVLLTPSSYFQNMREWPDIYTDQIKNAGIIVFSKAENELTSVINNVTEAIRTLNSHAEIIANHYTSQNTEWWKGLMHAEGEIPAPEVSDDPGTSAEQVSMKYASLKNVTELIVLLEDILHGQFGHIVRAKGVIKVGEEILRYDLADRLYTIAGMDDPNDAVQCVFIGTEIAGADLCKRLYTTPLAEHIPVGSAAPQWLPNSIVDHTPAKESQIIYNTRKPKME